MSVGSVVPSVEETMHLIVSVAIHKAQWPVRDMLIGGVSSVASDWPSVEDPPPAGLAVGDLVALRSPEANAAGCLDVIVLEHTGGNIAVRLHRYQDGYGEAWDAGTHTAVAGALSLTNTLSVPPVGGYGEVVLVGPKGWSYVQLETSASTPQSMYCGYIDGTMRDAKGEGADLGDGPEPFPALMLTDGDAVPAPCQIFALGAVAAAESPRLKSPANVSTNGNEVPAYPATPAPVYFTPSVTLMVGTVPYMWWVDAVDGGTSYTRLWTSTKELLLLRNLAIGPLEHPHRVLTHGGAFVV